MRTIGPIGRGKNYCLFKCRPNRSYKEPEPAGITEYFPASNAQPNPQLTLFDTGNDTLIAPGLATTTQEALSNLNEEESLDISESRPGEPK